MVRDKVREVALAAAAAQSSSGPRDLHRAATDTNSFKYTRDFQART